MKPRSKHLPDEAQVLGGAAPGARPHLRIASVACFSNASFRINWNCQVQCFPEFESFQQILQAEEGGSQEPPRDLRLASEVGAGRGLSPYTEASALALGTVREREAWCWKRHYQFGVRRETLSSGVRSVVTAAQAAKASELSKLLGGSSTKPRSLSLV